jgi:hypothetical protein
MQWFNCPQCGQYIQQGASPCPHCHGTINWDKLPTQITGEHTGFPSRFWWKNAPAAKILVLFIVLAIVIPSIVIYNSRHSAAVPPPEPQTVSLHTDISASDYTVYIINKDSFNWEGVHIYLNGFDYEYEVASVAAGKALTLSLIDFATSKGDRFNPYLKKLNSVYITTDTPDGAVGYER